MNLPPIRFALSFCLTGLAGVARAQDTPLPDLPTLMHQVEIHQRAAEATQKNYIYKQTLRADKLDSKGRISHTQSRVEEVFWLNGVEVARTLQKDGKPLSPDEARKEDERIDKEAARARAKRDKADSEGKQTDSRGHAIFPLSRFLELAAFTHERREQINGRPTIVADFAGDPRARTYNEGEKAIRDTEGTLWIDEADQVVQHLDARFVNTFRIGGGLLASISQGTRISFIFRKIKDEVWLPDAITGNGKIRLLLLFSTDGDFTLETSDYRKFHASSKVLPGTGPVSPEAEVPSRH